MKNKKENMKIKKAFTLVISAVFCASTFTAIASAETIELEQKRAPKLEVAPILFEDNCSFEEPEEPSYNYQLISVRKPLKVETDEVFKVKVFMKNTGNTPWFSLNSYCSGSKFNLGTEKERDRQSAFFANDLSGWHSNNRIILDQDRVNPGDLGSFTFEAMAPSEESIFTEYFNPVLEGVTWLEQTPIKMQFIVGDPDLTFENIRKKFAYAKLSGDTDKLIDLDADKKVLVDLANQEMHIVLGDVVIDEFPISTGTYRTPTPTGRHTILGKNHVRVGGNGPNGEKYVMPRFQLLGIRGARFTGYGIHALPSIGTSALLREIRSIQARGEEVPHDIYAGNVLWTEAVEHLGRQASHGCIRVGPDDADFLFDYTEVGETEVIVERSLDDNRIQEILQEVM